MALRPYRIDLDQVTIIRQHGLAGVAWKWLSTTDTVPLVLCTLSIAVMILTEVKFSLEAAVIRDWALAVLAIPAAYMGLKRWWHAEERAQREEVKAKQDVIRAEQEQMDHAWNRIRTRAEAACGNRTEAGKRAIQRVALYDLGYLASENPRYRETVEVVLWCIVEDGKAMEEVVAEGPVPPDHPNDPHYHPDHSYADRVEQHELGKIAKRFLDQWAEDVGQSDGQKQ